MSTFSTNPARNAFSSLQRFVRKPREGAEFCELCATPLAPEHHHLLELDARRVTCACDPCAILFGGNTRQRYRRIPRDVVRLDKFAMDDEEWESLLIPINLAYFVYNSSAARVVAQYPSPGGAMESSLDLEYWKAIAERNPLLQKFRARRRGAAGQSHRRTTLLPRSHRPMLPAGRNYPHSVAWAFRRFQGVGSHRPVLQRS